MKILICLDKSASTEIVLHAAHELVLKNLNDVDLYVLHIIDETLANSIDGADGELKSALQARSREIKKMAENIFIKTFKYLEEYGPPNDKIKELLKSMNYDLVIIGSHGRTQLKNTLLGSFAISVMKNSTKPVTIARVPIN